MTRFHRTREHLTCLPDWLSRSLRAGDEALTERCGGPARRRVIVILALVLSVSSADNGAVGAMAPQLEAAFRIGNLQIGVLSTVASLVGALATLPMGVLTDRTRRTRLLSVSIAIWGLAEAAGGLSPNFVFLLLTRTALGAVAATAGPAIGSLTGDFFPAGERARIYGLILSGELLGAGAGLLVSGNIAAALSWRAGFIVLAFPSLALAWVVHRYLPEPARGGQSRLAPGAQQILGAAQARRQQSSPRSEPVRPARSTLVAQVEESGIEPNPEIVLHGDPASMSLLDAIRWVLRVRTNVLLIVSSSLGYFFFAGLKTFAVLFARGQYGISQSVATLLAVVVGGAAIVGIVGFGHLADRWLERGRLDARLLVAAAGYLGACVLFVPALLTHNLLIALPLVIAAAAALSGPNSPGDAARLDVVPSRMWGRTEAIRTFLRTMFEASAPLLFGFVSELFGSPSSGGLSAGVNQKAARVSDASAHGLALAFLVMLVPLAASGYFLIRARRTYPADAASAAESDEQLAPAVAG